ncbi:Calcium uptake protein 3, mitochondrial [Nymphon striatum]|nr:Calcium uptake protein 3, mitochondrial [Nymphon striatum]
MFNRNVEIQPIMTGNVALDQVDRYTYLGQLISIHRDWEPEVRRRVALGWQAFGRLNNVWRSKLPLCLKRKNEDTHLTEKLTSREMRFWKFSSIEYEGQLYMTPQDFLESVTEGEPRPRVKRLHLTDAELQKMQASTPSRRKGSPRLFRNLHSNEPRSGFRIAFNMFDRDGNERVDKQEFLVVLHVIASSFFTKSAGKLGLFTHVPPVILEQIFSSVAKMRKEQHDDDAQYNEKHLEERRPVSTSLMVHLFGQKGNEVLTYDDFYGFMDNLQTEVLELEFNEFSRGMPTISECDFGKILLRYTYIHSDDYVEYIERLQDRLPHEKVGSVKNIGISFNQFKTFCQFLNNLDDFAIAMRMYTFANQPVSQEEFQRVVKICTGHELDKNIVNTVFQTFDKDGDGYLSYKEFIAIMRDRLHRGFRSHLVKSEGWEAFKSCVNSELRS